MSASNRSPEKIVDVGTPRVPFQLAVGADGRLYNARFGSREVPRAKTEGSGGDSLTEAYPPGGTRYIFEPALRVVHADGNTSTDLVYASHEGKEESGMRETRVELRDPAYPLEVSLVFRSYAESDVIEQWSEIRHAEPRAVVLERFASAAPQLTGEIWLTHFHGEHADEMNPVTERLTPGIKVIDSKIIVRSNRFAPPLFQLGLDAPPREDAGEVWAGMLDWAGSFQLAFEDNGLGQTRVLAGINPYGSAYHLDPGAVFRTPAMRWAWSGAGLGELSRKLHRWVRRHALRDGDKLRAIRLNNWEATFFDFDETRLVSLFDEAKDIGIELFLLDDGWFGTKHPRNADNAGLGDWEINTAKLPRGLDFLASEAKKRGLRFGIWIEPEMVNLASKLFEEHPDWVVCQRERELEIQRSQLVLDLTRPEVQAFQLGVIDDLLSGHPGISYVKWDANRYITQPGSSWLPADRQSNFAVDHANAVHALMAESARRHPGVEMMLCSGGGGRVDYGSLRHFHEFWPSDNTDPVRRVAMQWEYSTFYPAIAVSGHVTRWGERPIKFAFDVAMSVRLGMDVDLTKFSPESLRQARRAIADYKTHLRDIVQLGDLHRLEPPSSGVRAALGYVTADGSRAAFFIYQLAAAEPRPVKLAGLDAKARYRLTELNASVMDEASLPRRGEFVPGDALMSGGLEIGLSRALASQVVLLERAG